MRKTNKKGFTIIELVIVITVIAILAGVLIPTFASVIKKANISADQQLASMMTDSLKNSGKTPANFDEALAILREDGYDVASLNARTSNYYLVWEKSTNQIILVDKNLELVYADATLAADTTVNSNWHFAVAPGDKADAIKSSNGTVVPTITKNYIGKDAAKVVEILKTNGIVTISENVKLTEAPDHPSNGGKDGIRIKDGQDVTLTMSGMTMNADFDAWGYNVFQVNKGSLTLKDGTITAAAKDTAKPNTQQNLYGIVRVGNDDHSVQVQARVENMTLNFAAKPGATSTGGVFVVGSKGAKLYVKNTVVTTTKAVGAEIAYGYAEFENVTITAPTSGDWFDTCASASFGGTLVIKSGSYTGADTAASILTSGGTIKINGGIFTSNDDSPLRLHAISYDGAVSTIEITGGTFNGKAWNTITKAEWVTLCEGVTEAGVTVTDAKVTLTLD